MTRFVFVVLFSLMRFVSISQLLAISGFVKDENGNPISSATLSPEKGKSYVVVTNKSGYYRIDQWDNNDLITCTHVNYNSKVEKIEGNNIINFFLTRKTPEVTRFTLKVKREDIPNRASQIDKDYIGDYATRVEVASVIPEKIKDKFNMYVTEKIADVLHVDSLKNITGTIKVGVNINNNGIITGTVLIKGVQKAYDDTVLDAISKILKWIPAEQNGRKVDSYQDITVEF